LTPNNILCCPSKQKYGYFLLQFYRLEAESLQYCHSIIYRCPSVGYELRVFLDVFYPKDKCIFIQSHMSVVHLFSPFFLKTYSSANIIDWNQFWFRYILAFFGFLHKQANYYIIMIISLNFSNPFFFFSFAQSGSSLNSQLPSYQISENLHIALADFRPIYPHLLKPSVYDSYPRYLWTDIYLHFLLLYPYTIWMLNANWGNLWC